MRRIWSQIFQTGGTNVFGLVIQVFVLAITARVLGPTGRGLFVAGNSWVLLFGIFGSLSLGQVLVHQAAEDEGEAWRPQNLGALLAILGAATLVLWVLALLGYLVTGGDLFNHLTPTVLVLSFAALPFILGLENGRYVLLALDALPAFNLAQVIGNLVGLAAMILFLYVFQWGLAGALFGFLVWQSGIVLLIFRAVLQRVDRLVFRFRDVVALLKGSARLHLNAIGTVLFTQATIVMVNHFGQPEEAGFFQLATQIILVIQIAPVAISLVTYTLVAQKGAEGAWKEQRILLGQALLLVGLIAGAAYLAAPLGVKLVAGDQFLPAVPLFRILLLTLLGMTFSLLMASQWIGRGLFVQASLITFGVGVLNVVGNLLFIPRYGVTGAAWVSVFIYSLAVLVNGVFAFLVERQWRAGGSYNFSDARTAEGQVRHG